MDIKFAGHELVTVIKYNTCNKMCRLLGFLGGVALEVGTYITALTENW